MLLDTRRLVQNPPGQRDQRGLRLGLLRSGRYSAPSTRTPSVPPPPPGTPSSTRTSSSRSLRRRALRPKAGQDDPTGNAHACRGTEVAVLPRRDDESHAGSRGRCPPPAETLRRGVGICCVHRDVSCPIWCPGSIKHQHDIILIDSSSRGPSRFDQGAGRGSAAGAASQRRAARASSSRQKDRRALERPGPDPSGI